MMNGMVEESQMETKVTSDLETVLSGLKKFTNYSVEVLAFTRTGDGRRSESITCSTNEDVPQAPASIKVVASSLDSIMITWQPPVKPNGNIKLFTVYMRRLDLPNEDIVKHVLHATETMYEATGLKSNRRYEFWVTASTSIGEGLSTPVVALSTGSPVVSSKIVSFGGAVRKPWKSKAHLQCKAVGIPTPQRDWNINGRFINSSESRKILSDGTLEILDAQPEDNGNYSCRVSNNFGADEITYHLIIEVPPNAPSLFVSSSTYTSIETRWERKREGRLPIIGYYLHYKRDFGEWEEVFVEQEHDRYLINGLECGTRYQICISAVNKLGRGNRSEVVLAKTKGSAPVQPLKHHFISEDRNFVVLRLESWSSGGCLILYFVVEYKLIKTGQWKLVSNNVLYQQREFLIPDLNVSTWYSLRVTAHNNAGSTTATYEFATLNSMGGTISPIIDLEHGLDDIPLYNDIRVFIPAVISLIAIVLLTSFVCIYCKRKQIREDFYTVKSSDKEQEPKTETKANCEKNSSVGSFTYLLRSNSKVAFKDSALLMQKADNISPYATTQIATAQNKERIYGQMLSNQASNKNKEENLEGTFPRTKKQTSLLLQHFPQSDILFTPEYIHPYPSGVPPKDKPYNISQYSAQPWLTRSAPGNGNDFQVPDLLDHSAESSSSNDSSLDYHSKGYPEDHNCPSPHVKRQLYPDINYDPNARNTYMYKNSEDDYREDDDISDNEYTNDNKETLRIPSLRRNQSQPIHRLAI